MRRVENSIDNLLNFTMRKFIGIAAIAVILLSTSVSLQAQKFGYINSAKILSELPEMTQLQSTLKDLQTQLEKQGQQMIKDYQAQEQDAMRKAERGEMAPVEQEKVGKQLQEAQAKIQAFSQEIQTRLGAKQEELFKPISDRMNTVIEALAAEKGLDYILDESTGVILYADESQDLSAEVKARLMN